MGSEMCIRDSPISKTDTRALGCVRSWGCTCSGDPALPCPLHAIQEQVAACVALAMRLDLDPHYLPLFPRIDGERITKTDAVNTIVAIASRLGAPTICSTSGGQLYGGHSLRTGGAQYLAGLGVDPLRIQSMGRWRSALVVRYSCDKGSCGITRDAVRGISERANPRVVKAIPIALGARELDSAARVLFEHELAVTGALAQKPAYVLNKLSWVLHRFKPGGDVTRARTPVRYPVREMGA